MRKEERIKAAIEINAIAKQICTQCSASLGLDEGLQITTEDSVFAICAGCEDTLEVEYRQYPRRLIWERIIRFSSNAGDVPGDRLSRSYDQVVAQSLSLGLKVSTRKHEIVWAFDGYSPGWKGDGNDAPSWYSSNASRWTDYVLREKKTGELLTRRSLQGQVRISIKEEKT